MEKEMVLRKKAVEALEMGRLQMLHRQQSPVLASPLRSVPKLQAFGWGAWQFSGSFHGFTPAKKVGF